MRSRALLRLAGMLAAGMLTHAASLAAPASRSVQGRTYDEVKRLPDWSGIWVLAAGGQEAGADSHGTDNGRVPLTPKYRQMRDAARAAEAQANMSTCLPAGPTAILSHGVLTEFLLTPGRVTILFEDGEIRRIRTDGSAHRDLEELSTSFMGDSIGHWEGQTLVVDTIGFPNGEIFQNHGVRATRNTHLEERFHLAADGQLQIDTSMTDPAIFVSPYRFTRLYKRSTLPLYESVCAQNNRDTGTTMDLTPPPEE